MSYLNAECITKSYKFGNNAKLEFQKHVLRHTVYE
jgi:hypothetical protein